ncbi:MAG: hypothetical protein IJQ71_02970 [Clostridia bacterium]|nr:hypothetical protein [Clostridia bacterium]
MKKMIAMLIALVMMLSLTAALAEDYADVEDNPEMTAMFSSDWASGMSHIMIFPIGEEASVQIWNDDETIQWQYSCVWDAEKKVLATQEGGFGEKYSRVLDEEGAEISRNLEKENIQAVFSLNDDGYLVWKDLEEDAGAGRIYEKIGWFAGDWEYIQEDGTQYQASFIWDVENVESESGLDIYTGYKVNIVKYGTDGVILYWDYAGQYDPETESLNVVGCKSYQTEENAPVENAYDNGSAIFTLHDQCVYWRDLTEEDAGNGLVFESANG